MNLLGTTVITIFTSIAINLLIELVPFLAKKKAELLLELGSYKSQFTFAKLHEARSEVIREVYKKIVHTERVMSVFVSPLKHQGESIEKMEAEAAESIDSLVSYYLENKIVLPDTVSKKIDTIVDKFKDNYFSYQTNWRDYLDLSDSLNRTAIKSVHREMKKSWESMKTEIPTIKSELESELRGLMGE
jgi:hypothetical protein